MVLYVEPHMAQCQCSSCHIACYVKTTSTQWFTSLMLSISGMCNTDQVPLYLIQPWSSGNPIHNHWSQTLYLLWQTSHGAEFFGLSHGWSWIEFTAVVRHVWEWFGSSPASRKKERDRFGLLQPRQCATSSCFHFEPYNLYDLLYFYHFWRAPCYPGASGVAGTTLWIRDRNFPEMLPQLHGRELNTKDKEQNLHRCVYPIESQRRP